MKNAFLTSACFVAFLTGCGRGATGPATALPSPFPVSTGPLSASSIVVSRDIGGSQYDVETASGRVILPAETVADLAITSTPALPGDILVDVRTASESETVSIVRIVDGSTISSFPVAEHIGPVHVSADALGNIAIPGAATGSVNVYNSATGSLVRTVSGLNHPQAAINSASGTLYVADTAADGNAVIYSYPADSTSELHSLEIPGFAIQGLAFADDGSILVAAAVAFGGDLLEVDTGLSASHVLLSTGIGSPVDLAADAHGNTYVASTGAAAIVVVQNGSTVSSDSVSNLHGVALEY